jgi:hypothetical protein
LQDAVAMPKVNSSQSDPIRKLQCAVRSALAHLAPDSAPSRVAVWDQTGKKVIDLIVPASGSGDTDTHLEAPTVCDLPTVKLGWIVTDRVATYDGRAVPVPRSRLALLRVLAEADGPRTAKELTLAAFDSQTTIENTRFHIRELRKELQAAFGSEDDPVPGDDNGYRLTVR